MQLPVLDEFVIILSVSVLVVYLCSHLRIPAVIGFLISGALIGPYGLQLISHVHEVEMMAEIGIVFLLFTIGAEFSFENFPQIRNAALIGGTLQVGFTILATSIIISWLGEPLSKAVFWGFLFSLSSTAIVLNLLQRHAELESPHGKATLAILLYQDLIIVPMMLFLPLLAGQATAIVSTILLMLIKAAFIIALAFILGKYGIDFFMHQIARTRSRELFFISVIALCFFITWLSSILGLSLGLGAFLAGLVISQSKYNHQTLAGILPFRDTFISFFFISVGMLLDVEQTLAFGLPIAGIVASVILLKGILGTLAIFLLGLPLRTALLTGFALSQIGEFAFVLSRAGLSFGLLEERSNQMFLSISILTMILTPFILRQAPAWVDALLQLHLPQIVKNGLFYKQPSLTTEAAEPLNDHLVIVGFGVCGAHVAHAARAIGIRYHILEMNPDTVRREQKNGEPIFYGDASYESVLEHAAIQEARILVVTIPDPAAIRRIIELSRRMNPKLYILVRTRFVQEIRPLMELGADEVIPEEFETSIEIFSRVLAKYMISKNRIEELIFDIRKNEYQMLRSLRPASASIDDFSRALSDMDLLSLPLPDRSPLIGQTLQQADLRKRHELTLLAVYRSQQTIANPASDFIFQAGDNLILFGAPDKLKYFAEECC